MTINDPIADALTRIRNANMVKHESVSMPASNLKEELVKKLEKEQDEYLENIRKKGVGCARCRTGK